MSLHDPEASIAFDDYRAARLNAKYHAFLLSRWRRASITLDVITASSTAVTALKAFSGAHPEVVQSLAAISAIAAVLKISLRIDKNVERYAKIVSRYSELTERYRQLLNEYKASGAMSAALKKTASECAKMTRELSSFDDAQPSRRRLIKLQAEVNEEIPPSFLSRNANRHPGAVHPSVPASDSC